MFIGLVSRGYVLDLHRSNSLARTLLDAGHDVFYLDWGVPTAADARNELETYTHTLLPRALRKVLSTSQAERASILGYCMGGNLALLALATQDLSVGALVTMATPIDFSALSGLAAAVGSLPPDKVLDWTGNVPPQYLAAFFRARTPTADVIATARLWENMWNESYVESHQAIARWAREHVPFPGVAFRQTNDQWLRDNGFRTGRLRMAGQPVDLSRITLPMLSVIALRDDLVPAPAARAISDVVSSTDFSLLEIDAGHAGLIASRTAAKRTMPAVANWLAEHAETNS